MTRLCQGLNHHGNNIIWVCDCNQTFKRTSKFGRMVHERVLARDTEFRLNAEFKLNVQAWLRNPSSFHRRSKQQSCLSDVSWMLNGYGPLPLLARFI